MGSTLVRRLPSCAGTCGSFRKLEAFVVSPRVKGHSILESILGPSVHENPRMSDSILGLLLHGLVFEVMSS